MSLDISKAIVDEIKNPFSIDSHVYNTSYDLVKSAYNVRNDFDSTYDDINFDVCKLFFDSEIPPDMQAVIEKWRRYTKDKNFIN